MPYSFDAGVNIFVSLAFPFKLISKPLCNLITFAIENPLLKINDKDI